MWHPSPLDPKDHASGVVYDDQEVELAKIHVAQNPSEQEVATSFSQEVLFADMV
jgi:hypothetical protein